MFDYVHLSLYLFLIEASEPAETVVDTNDDDNNNDGDEDDDDDAAAVRSPLVARALVNNLVSYR